MRLLILILVGVIALLLGASSAQAALTRTLTGHFGPFTNPQALTVDPQTGDLYIVDPSDATVSRVDSSGAPVDFTAGPDSGTNTLTGFAFDAPSAAQVAVDRSGGPNDGDVYVADSFGAVVKIFAHDGAPLGALDGSSNANHAFGEPCGVAVDQSDGTVFVADYGSGLWRYQDDGVATEADLRYTGGVSTDIFPCAAAADGGQAYAANWPNGPLKRYRPFDFEIGSPPPFSAGSQVDGAANAVSTDPTTGDVYVNEGGSVTVFDAAGTSLYTFGSAAESGAFSAGVAVGPSGGNAYVSDLDNGEIDVFGPTVPLADANTLDADGVTDTAATVHGSVNPRDAQLTDCRFDYGPTSSYGASAPCVPDAASIPADSSDHPVSADLSGLTPGTTYHVRLAASTALGTAEGADRIFTTAISAPTITSQAVDAIGTSDAAVKAKINPKGAETTYHVEYGTDTSYGRSTSESAPISGADDSDHPVVVAISGLTPRTQYHFRFVATNSVDSTEGGDTTFATYAPPPTFDPCANDPLRTGPGARLPDCRAYEQASPADKHGADAEGKPNLVQASTAGDRVSFGAPGGLPTTGGSTRIAPFIASRGAGSWTTNGVIPATPPGAAAFTLGWDDTLATTVSSVSDPSARGLYLGDTDTGTWQRAIDDIGDPTLDAFAADPDHLLFEDPRALLPGAGDARPHLYDLDHGALTLAGRVPLFPATSCDDSTHSPDCVVPDGGSFAGPYDFNGADLDHGGSNQGSYLQTAISSSGSKVFFTEAGTGRLYLREDGTRTVQINASQAASPDPNGPKPAAYVGATPDGATVYFLSCERLTDDSTAASTAAHSCTDTHDTGPPTFSTVLSQGSDLYSYDTGSGDLTDLTVDSNPADSFGAQVVGLLGASPDGSYVYFAANGVLAGGAAAGNCTYRQSDCSVYLAHDGQTTFVARLAGRFDAANWTPRRRVDNGTVKTSRVAAQGGSLLFTSNESLTGYDNASSDCGDGRCTEIYRYDPAGSDLLCLSCNPTGQKTMGNSVLTGDRSSFTDAPTNAFLTRNLSPDGTRAFFNTPDPLVAADTNAVTDVYEWEAAGTGSCADALVNGGCLYLLSTGKSTEPSFFGDASASGDDVFLFTRQSLVPGDADASADVYDARVGGGLTSQHQTPPAGCVGEACQGAGTPPPSEPGSDSSAFSGPGNQGKSRGGTTPAKPGKKCNKHKKKCKKRKQRRHASSNNGGAK